MKAVLISIQPKWCELIASGKKTVEVRKTKPKIETPFKCYIYCTQGNGYLESVNGKVQKLNYLELDLNVDNYVYELNGKVIGEFVCDKIIKLNYSCGSYRCEGLDRVENDRIASASQLSLYDMKNYLTCKGGYAWHISDLVIYDKPKELREFNHCGVNYHFNPPITRPPQSWCYVEELR